MLFAAQQALPMVLWLVVGGIILRKFNYEKDYHLEIREETRYVKFSEHMGKSLSFFILNFYWKALVRLARMMQKAAPGQLLFGEPTNKILPPSLKVKEASDSDGVRMCSEFLVLHLILHDIRTDIGPVSVRYRVAVPSRIKSPLQQEDGIIVKMKGKGDVWNLMVDSDQHVAFICRVGTARAKPPSSLWKGCWRQFVQREDCWRYVLIWFNGSQPKRYAPVLHPSRDKTGLWWLPK